VNDRLLQAAAAVKTNERPLYVVSRNRITSDWPRQAEWACWRPAGLLVNSQKTKIHCRNYSNATVSSQELYCNLTTS